MAHGLETATIRVMDDAPMAARAPGRPAKARTISTPAPVAIRVKKGRKTISKAPKPRKPVKVAPPKAMAAKKPSGKPTLADSMALAMRMSRRMRADEIIAAMAKAGLKSKSKNMRTMVYAVLAKDKRFKRVGRGLYVVG